MNTQTFETSRGAILSAFIAVVILSGCTTPAKDDGLMPIASRTTNVNCFNATGSLGGGAGNAGATYTRGEVKNQVNALPGTQSAGVELPTVTCLDGTKGASNPAAEKKATPASGEPKPDNKKDPAKGA